MGSRWRKAKLSLGLNLCVYVPKTLDDVSSFSSITPSRSALRSDSDALLSPIVSDPSDFTMLMPTTPMPSSSGLRLSKSGSNSSKTCAICLDTMKPGQGHALFTAECSHTFHFHCIASNVKQGNHNCPVCRAKWKEVPLDFSNKQTTINPRVNYGQYAGQSEGSSILRRLPRSNTSVQQHHRLPPLFRDLDPCEFNDDEPLEPVPLVPSPPNTESHSHPNIEIKTFTELSEIGKFESKNNFTVLIHLKAPRFVNHAISKAPIDLVTVLDTSGSMVGTKLALLKQAMGFVIQNLSPSDRLSVISFSSTARRLFPLIRMTESGRQRSLHEINLLKSNGGTNIAEGLRKGVKVIEERRERNPVCSIILLSDGQDTYTITPTNSLNPRSKPDYCVLLPPSVCRNSTGTVSVPVHVFGFGVDHDSASLHSISEASGGTFSFIEAESAIQDAFAQCIGGLLSVMAQKLRVDLEIPNSKIKFCSIKSGNYVNHIEEDNKIGLIDVGDLYAEEERDFLVSINIPPVDSNDEIQTLLFKVGCGYTDPMTKSTVIIDKVEVKVSRPINLIPEQIISIEVDRQKNRFLAAEAMEESRVLAESGELSSAVTVLEACRKTISDSVSSKLKDVLCVTLDAELKEMQERMKDRQKYEVSGRAYVLSGLSSHSWQRATARGDFAESASLMYQTSSMVDMVQRSQTINRTVSKMRHAKSFPARPEPR